MVTLVVHDCFLLLLHQYRQWWHHQEYLQCLKTTFPYLSWMEMELLKLLPLILESKGQIHASKQKGILDLSNQLRMSKEEINIEKQKGFCFQAWCLVLDLQSTQCQVLRKLTQYLSFLHKACTYQLVNKRKVNSNQYCIIHKHLPYFILEFHQQS